MNTSGTNAPARLLAVLLLIAAGLLAYFAQGGGVVLAYGIPGLLALIALLIPLSLLMAQQWEKAVILRLG